MRHCSAPEEQRVKPPGVALQTFCGYSRGGRNPPRRPSAVYTVARACVLHTHREISYRFDTCVRSTCTFRIRRFRYPLRCLWSDRNSPTEYVTVRRTQSFTAAAARISRLEIYVRREIGTRREIFVLFLYTRPSVCVHALIRRFDPYQTGRPPSSNLVPRPFSRGGTALSGT